MRYYCAPMEGVTGCVFRRVHHRLFPGTDKYYMPFISPTAEHLFTPRELRELSPENNGGAPAVPQLLTKVPADFLWAANALAERGFGEVDLNLGCPSATVTAKGKGAGLLADPARLSALLDGIFKAPLPLRVSVKTRLGTADPAEFERLLEIYNSYPISELIVHTRTRRELYRGDAHRELLPRLLAESRPPLCYNGDLATAADLLDIGRLAPALPAVMAGRGLAADPALFRKARGGPPASREELRVYHDALYDEYTAMFGRLSAMKRMKELWRCLSGLFDGSEKPAKKLFRTQDCDAYDYLADAILALPLRQDARPIWYEEAR